MDEYVVANILSPDKSKVYFVKKDKPHKPYLHNKLIGFGGKVEPIDKSINDALIREVKEELDITLDLSQVEERGFVIDKRMGKVWMFMVYLDYELEEKYVENEGFAKYYPLDYFRDNINEFLEGDLVVLEKLFFTDEKLDLDYREL